MVASTVVSRDLVDRLKIGAVSFLMFGLCVMIRCQCFSSGFHDVVSCCGWSGVMYDVCVVAKVVRYLRMASMVCMGMAPAYSSDVVVSSWW